MAITGTSLIGIGVLPQLIPAASNPLTHAQLGALWWVALSGFVLSCIGKGLTSLFAADAVVVKQNAAQITAVAAAVDKINQSGPNSDTDHLVKPTPITPQ